MLILNKDQVHVIYINLKILAVSSDYCPAQFQGQLHWMLNGYQPKPNIGDMGLGYLIF